MKTAYVSLHTDRPEDQNDKEISYGGYRRVAIEYENEDDFIEQEVLFPVIEDSSEDILTFICIGTSEHDHGEILMIIPTLPMKMQADPRRLKKRFWMESGATLEQATQLIKDHGYIAPRVLITNTNPIDMPENLNPIARVARKLIDSGKIQASDLHPKLYEAINDALHNAGVPVIQIARGGAARIDIKTSEMKSLSFLGHSSELH